MADVAGLTFDSIDGIMAETLAQFVANRLLPPTASFAGYERMTLEM